MAVADVRESAAGTSSCCAFPVGNGKEKLHEGEFDAAAHGINALGADTHAIAVLPRHLTGLGAAPFAGTITPGACSRSSLVSSGHSDDGVVLLSIYAAGARGFFEGVDGQKAFNEDLEEFDKTTEFLHGDDQPVVLLAEMLFHELRGLPVHQFAFGAISAALGFGGFGGHFLELAVRIDHRFGSAWENASGTA